MPGEYIRSRAGGRDGTALQTSSCGFVELTHDSIVHSNILNHCVMHTIRPLLGFGVECFILACFAAYASASTEVIQGYVFRGANYDITGSVPRFERGPTPTKNLTAGAVVISQLVLTDQATNATIGESLGFCVALRDGGPSQCQITLQLAPGAVQVCCRP